MNDLYAHWRLCLASKTKAGVDLPRCGWWRRRKYRGGPFQPIAIYMVADRMVCAIGSRTVPVERVWAHWLEPVSEDAHRFAVYHGRFPDELPSNSPADPFTTELTNARPALPPKGKAHG